MEGSHGVEQGLALAQLLLTLPFANLIPRHAVEDVVLVADPEESGREPPFDESSDPRSPAPAVRIAATLVVARVVDAMEQRAVGHGGSVARLRRITEPVGQRRGVKWSHVAEPRIGPRTKRQPPSASGGNMYLQWSQRTSAWWAGR